MSTLPVDSLSGESSRDLIDGYVPTLEAIASPLGILDQQGQWRFVNQAGHLLLGDDGAIADGRRGAALTQTLVAAGPRAIALGEVQIPGLVLTDAGGDPRQLLATLRPLATVAGETLLLVSFEDRTPLHQVEQTLQRQSERERLLGAIAQHLLQSLNPDDLLQTTVNEVRRFLHIDRVLFYSFDPDYDGVVAESASDAVSDSGSSSGSGAGSGAGGAVLDRNQRPQGALSVISADLMRYRRGEMTVIDDVATAGLPPAYQQAFDQAQVKACLTMPIVQGEALYGLVCALHYRSARPWAAWEIETLREVSTQVGGAIKQARLYHQVQQLNSDLEEQVAQRTEQLQTALDFEATLKRITDRVRDSLDVSQIILTAVQELTEALEVKGSNSSLYDLEQGTSTIYYEYNSSSPSYQGRVAQMEAFPEVYHQLLDGQDFQFCSVEPNPVRGYVAMLACPIVDDRGVLGDLWLIHDRDYGFRDIEIRLVQQVANQCAIAIRQARLYQAAQSQVAELERLNTLKDDFLSTVSHELRTPVTSMRVALQLLGVTLNQEFDLTADLGKPKAERSRIGRYYSILQEECEREISLINDLLDLQRLDVGNHPVQPEPILLDSWLSGWIDSFVTRAKSRNQTLTLVTAPALPVVHSDMASLERVVAELLNNACKYTPPGERITLEVLADPQAPSDRVKLVLTNTGVSIPAEEMTRIFDKFYRVPSADPWKQGGTGLGLALVKKLINHLGGNIDVSSDPTQTCFTLVLPTQPALSR